MSLRPQQAPRISRPHLNQAGAEWARLRVSHTFDKGKTEAQQACCLFDGEVAELLRFPEIPENPFPFSVPEGGQCWDFQAIVGQEVCILLSHAEPDVSATPPASNQSHSSGQSRGPSRCHTHTLGLMGAPKVTSRFQEAQAATHVSH